MTAVAEIAVTVQAAAPSLSSQLLGSGLIGLREGLETGIVVMILIVFLVKSAGGTHSTGCGSESARQSR
jgi:high-affinity iron transporter